MAYGILTMPAPIIDAIRARAAYITDRPFFFSEVCKSSTYVSFSFSGNF